jgi:deoxyribodipyrimidine photo-lyase
LIRRGPSLEALRKLVKETGATHVAWNRRYEPAVITRDTGIKKALAADGLDVESFNGALLYEPMHVATKEGKPYQVFSPFWRALLGRDEPAEPVPPPKKLKAAEKQPKSVSIESLGLLPTIDWAGTMRKTWSPGEAGAEKRLERFVERGVADYHRERDRPDHDGTSALSPHLHFGELSPRRAWHAVRAAAGGKPVAKLTGGAEAYLRELGWREFASHLLYHFPHTANTPLRADYARFPWAKDPVGLRAWQRGRTGFPIVDAGMRQLWATGWMHNRVRMIVASFLVKDLRITWLEGARWFWDTLVDADLAANTLGWQWAAGCGADAAPYFRIFNPTSQAEKFDPDEAYVKRWAGVDAANYPEPIVDHAEARKLALEALKAVSKK